MSHLIILIQLVILVVCPHILPPYPAIRHRPITTKNDATGVLLGPALRPSISIFGRRPRGQCTLVSIIIPQPPHTNLKSIFFISPDSFLPFPSGCYPAPARQEGTAGSPAYRALRIFLNFERLPLIQYCWRREPLPDLLSMHGFGGDLGSLGGKWLSETLTSIVHNPDLWRHARSYLQGQPWFLEKLEPTSTRVRSYSAANLLRQNRKSDGNEDNRVNIPRSCI